MWCAEELALAYESLDAGGAFGLVDTPEYRALNPNGRIPMIEDDGFVLWESNSIIRYLANQYGGDHLYPQAARARARVDQWLDWQASDLNKSWSYAFLSLVRQSPAHQDLDALSAGCREWARHMGILERQLETTGGYACGAHFSLADIVLGLSVNRWFETPLAHPDFAALKAYYERLSLRPGYVLHGRNGTP